MNNKNQHIPAGYKSSPLGIIPEDWEVKRLGEVCDVDNDSLSNKTDPNYEFDYISLSDVDSDCIEITTTRQIFRTAPSRARRIVKRGDVIISTVRPNLQAFSLIKNEVKDLIVSTGFAVLTPKQIKSEYLYQYVFSQPVSKQFYQLVVGSNYPAVNSSDVSHLKIAVPPLPEQHRIVSVLSFWDTAIAKQTALIEKLTIRKKGLMQQLLTGKKRLKGFEEEWRIHKIREHFIEIRDKNDGKGHIPMSISAKLGLVPQTDKFDRVVAGNSLDKYTLLRKGDFAYNKGNSNLYEMGCIYRLQEESAVVPFVYICFRVIDDTSCDFFQQFFINHGLDKQLKQIISSGARGDGLLNVNVEDFMSLKIPYPTIEEQNAIASILMQADKEIELAKQKLSSLQEQKKGLMQVLLTGKKRIK